MKRALAGGLLAAVVLGAAGCGGSRASQPDVRAVRDALAARLHAKQLRFSWVACVRNGRTFEGMPIVRCNVDFGDPHIWAYCSVLEHGRLVTNHENAAIPCGHDDAGYSAPIESS